MSRYQALFVAAVIMLAAGPASASTHSVTNGGDAGAGSYRQAIIDANGDGTPVVINFSAGLTVNLSSGDVVYTNSQPITLNGNGSIIDGDDAHQILDASAGPAVTVNDLTMRDGETTGDGGAIETGDDVTVNNSTFTSNRADGNGGAIRSSSGAITITNSLFAGNTSASDGGAVRNSSGTVEVIDSTFRDNTADGDGGAIRGSSTDFTVTGSTFEGNETFGGNGGAIRGSSSNLDATNSTFSGNTASGDGGLFRTSSGTVTLVHVTGVSNSAGGDGAHLRVDTLVAFGTVLTDPQGASSCEIVSSTTSNGFNYDTDGSCGFGAGSGDVSNGSDPQLGPLTDNGGPTETHLPQPGSPLVDAVTACDPTVTTDQRGIERPQQGDVNTPLGCDIGAVEVRGNVVVPTLTIWGWLFLVIVLGTAGFVTLRRPIPAR